MQKIEKYLKRNILLIISVIIFGIIFFVHNIVFNWDSSEYMGLAAFIGTPKMFDSWISHRGVLLPLLFKICGVIGFQTKFGFLAMMYIFYLIMIGVIVKIYRTSKKMDFLNNKIYSGIFIFWVILLIILNPIIFAYYHIILAEFFGITLGILSCYLAWKWIDTSHKKLYVLIFSLFVICAYHIKQIYMLLVILPVLLASLISVIKMFKLKNIFYRLVTLIIIVCSLRS